MAKTPLKLLPADHYRRVFQHYAPVETVLDDVLWPGYWANVAATLKIGDEVVVIPEDMSWRAHVLVCGVGRVEAIVQLLNHTVLSDEAVQQESDAYHVKWRGPHAMFGVVKRDDGAVVKDGFQVRDQANKWLASHMIAMAR